MSRYTPIIAFILFIALIFGGIFILKPKYLEFKDLKDQLEIKEKSLSEKENYFSNLKNILSKIEVYENSINKIEDAIPDTPSEPDVLNYIQEVSLKNDLSLKNLNVSGISLIKDGKKNLEKTSYNASLYGSYPNFKNFLQEIYKSARLIEIDSVNFSSAEKSNIFNINLVFSTYSLGQMSDRLDETPNETSNEILE